MDFRVSNPAFTSEAFSRVARTVDSPASMTVGGTIGKTAYLLVIVLLAAGFTWGRVAEGQPSMPLMLGGLIAGLVFGLVVSFSPRQAPWAAPLYATGEGLFLGGLSALLNARYPGVAGAALIVTFGAAAAVLGLWRTGLVRGGGIVMKVVKVSTVGIGIAYLVSFLMSVFGFGGLSILASTSPLGIAISVFICVIASLNLVWDFEFIESSANSGAPKPMEWFAAFGLLVTLVWMYIEILKLLVKLARNR